MDFSRFFSSPIKAAAGVAFPLDAKTWEEFTIYPPSQNVKLALNLNSWTAESIREVKCHGLRFQRRGARASISSSICWVTPLRCRDGQVTAEGWTPRVRQRTSAQSGCTYTAFIWIYYSSSFVYLQMTRQELNPFTQCIKATSSCSTCPPCCPTRKITNSRWVQMCITYVANIKLIPWFSSNTLGLEYVHFLNKVSF